MEFKEIKTREQYDAIIKAPVLIHYHGSFPGTVICIARNDACAVIADNYTNNLTLTDPLDLLVCDTCGPFVMSYGPAAGNRDEFTSKLAQYQLGETELPKTLNYLDWHKDYGFYDD